MTLTKRNINAYLKVLDEKVAIAQQARDEVVEMIEAWVPMAGLGLGEGSIEEEVARYTASKLADLVREMR